MAVAMTMALRRLSSSFDKPLRPGLFKATSLYYMVLFLPPPPPLLIYESFLKLIKNRTGNETVHLI
jgi:hypothetical protein